LIKSRFIYLMLIASLFAYSLACFRFHLPGLNGIDGMSDGGGLHL
jgi:hypothetical protein